MDSKINFAIGIQHFSRGRGGAERYLTDLCSRLAKEGHDVHVYAETWKEEGPGIHLHPIRVLPFPKSLRFLSFAMQATRAMKQGGHDLTFGVGNTLETDILQPHGGVHWAWFWRSLRVYENPISWTVQFLGRVFNAKQWVNGWVENAPYRKGSLLKVIAISDMVKRDMIRWYRIPDDRLTLIYNGVDPERFHPRNNRYRGEVRRRHGIGEEFLVLFVSNNFRMKGLGYLIRALAGLKDRTAHPFKLLILGRDRQEPYRRLSGRLGIGGEIVFAGTTAEPEKYYGAADLLVHPSFYDACSLTVLEALASGLPVITTAANGASGVLHEGREGFVLPDPRDAGGLGEKIAFFFDPERRREASLAARALAEDYSEEKNWREVIRTFQSCLSEKRSMA